MRKALLALAAVFVSTILLWWMFRPEEWLGFVYPNSSSLAVHQYVGTYTDLDQCRAATQAVIRALPEPSRADYECGLNCRIQSHPDDPMICDRTER